MTGTSPVRVIDAHMHLGECCVFDLNVTEQELLDRMDEKGISKAIVQPFPGCKDFRATHERIANLAAKHPGRFAGLCSLSPHRNPDEYTAEVERCIKQLGFVALKLHPLGHAVSPLSEDGMRAFAVAAEFCVPIMVHTGPGVPFAQPSLCLPAARKFPGLKIILAHAGFTLLSAEAQVMSCQCANIYLETSWCMSTDIGWMIRSLGPERVMYGSDLPNNMASELAKYHSLGLDLDTLRQVLGDTARSVFGLP